MKTCQQPCERRNKTVQAGAWTWSTTIRRQAAWRPGTSLALRNLLHMRLLEGSWLLLEGSGTLVGRLWGASWKALGRLLEASKRHLGPKTVRATCFGPFLKKKKTEILGVHLGDVLKSKIVFFRVPRRYPT